MRRSDSTCGRNREISTETTKRSDQSKTTRELLLETPQRLSKGFAELPRRLKIRPVESMTRQTFRLDEECHTTTTKKKMMMTTRQMTPIGSIP